MTLGLTRWNPTSDLERDPVHRFFNRFWEDTFRSGIDAGSSASRSWNPAVDIKETEDALTLLAELPGMAKDDVDVSLEKNVLTISGERRFEKDVEKESFHRIERSYGAFARSFTLPNNVKTDSVEASFDNGVLAIRLPKLEEAKPHKIKIR